MANARKLIDEYIESTILPGKEHPGVTLMLPVPGANPEPTIFLNTFLDKDGVVKRQIDVHSFTTDDKPLYTCALGCETTPVESARFYNILRHAIVSDQHSRLYMMI